MSKKECEKDTLGNRMKAYESLSTTRQLMPNCPVYARIDGRAFHTLCRGLEKPFSREFIVAMQETCKYLVQETHAVLGYVQSDEISLGWADYTHAPFDGRVQKLESVLASMASVKFLHWIGVCHSVSLRESVLWQRVLTHLPAFDCRVYNVPTMTELANNFLWRENDAIKNSISGMARVFYSDRELQGKNSDEQIHMMRMKGYCFFEETPPSFLRGSFWRRETFRKRLTKEEVGRIPERQRANLDHEVVRDATGQVLEECFSCVRSRIAEVELPWRLTDTKDIEEVLFRGGKPECNKENPTFVLTTKK